MFNAITQIMNLFGPQQQPPPSPDRPAVAPPPGAVQVDSTSGEDDNTNGRLFPDPLAADDDQDYYADEEGRQDDAANGGNGNGNGNGQSTTTVRPPPGSSQVTSSPAGTSSIPGLVCVPVATCPVPNIYGTRPAHFLRFGFVSPSAVRCDASAGQILCVQEPSATTTTTTEAGTTTTETTTTEAETTTTTTTTTEAETTTTTTTTETTTEAETTTTTETTAAPGTAPPPTVRVLACRRVADCAVVFGTRGDHFARYGEQAACRNSLVRCVTARPEETTETTPVLQPTPPTFTPGLPIGPVAPSVSIIGPQPIYVSYNNIIGPTVGACCGGGSSGAGDSPGKVSSSGTNSAQEREINTLLQGLRTRLQGIITSFRS